MNKMGRFQTKLIFAAGLLALGSGAAWSKTATEDFAQNCANCHTIGGGRLVGPDLKNVSQRRDRDWILRLVMDPNNVRASGEATFAELLKEYRGVMMATVPNMTRDRAEELLKLIEAESKLPKSRFAGSQLIERSLSESDAREGEALFLGKSALKNGGPSCLSCHSVGGLSGLGGGFLGPDLTTVFSKMGNENALAAWLNAPASPTMQPIYARHPIDPQELPALVAFLKVKAVEGSPADSISRLSFLIIGTVGVSGLFFLLDFIWRRRIRSVREAMISGTKDSEENHE